VNEGGEAALAADSEPAVAEHNDGETDKPRARRGRRGGNRNQTELRGEDQEIGVERDTGADPVTEPTAEPLADEKPKRRSRAKATPKVDTVEVAPTIEMTEKAAAEKPKRASRAKSVEPVAEVAAIEEAAAKLPKPRASRAKAKPAAVEAPDAATTGDTSTDEMPAGGRTGWWQRTFG
jgi:ribonuclease E